MKKNNKFLIVCVILFTIFTSCASKKKAGCDAYSKTLIGTETKKEFAK